MTVHIARAQFVAKDADQLGTALVSPEPRHALNALEVARIARHLVIFTPTPDDLARLIAAAHADLPDLAPLRTVQRVMSINPDSVLAIAQRHRFDAADPRGEGFVACLMLNADGMAALIASGAANAGMVAKLNACRTALDAGVAAVKIVDGKDLTTGTTLVAGVRA